MPRSLNPDGTPWWVSTGPPQSTQTSPQPTPTPAAAAAPSVDATASGLAGLLGITPQAQSAAISSGVGLVTAVLDLIAKPLAGSPPVEEVAPHDPATCGVCPLCVAVAMVRQHDAGLADLIESAMSGVTTSAEKLVGILPNALESLSETVVEAIVRAVLNKARP